MTKALSMVVMSNGYIVAVDEHKNGSVLSRLAYTPDRDKEGRVFTIADDASSPFEIRGKVLRKCNESEVDSFFRIALNWARNDRNKEKMINGIKVEIFEAI